MKCFACGEEYEDGAKFIDFGSDKEYELFSIGLNDVGINADFVYNLCPKCLKLVLIASHIPENYFYPKGET